MLRAGAVVVTTAAASKGVHFELMRKSFSFSTVDLDPESEHSKNKFNESEEK